jgi:GTPase SAR1 family protein
MHRVVFIGDTSVGKTSILLRLKGEPFNPNRASTIGATYSVHTPTLSDSCKVDIQLWDTAGQ